MEIKTVSIVGCGALGIMYASQFQKFLPPDRVRFLADADRIRRYEGAAFFANGEEQTFRFLSPDDCGEPSDLVIFTVKYNHLREAVRVAKNHVGEHTVILSFLNGITSEEILAETHPPGQILYSMVAGMDATKEGYAVRFTGTGYVAFGSLSGRQQREIDRVAAFFETVRQRYEVKPDILKTMWWKYILNIGINQTSALLRCPYAPFQAPGPAENMARMAMGEALAVSKALGIGLTEADLEDCFRLMRTLSPEGKTSMCQDIEANRPTEVDMFAGALMSLGAEHAVPTPVNEFLFNAIHALERRDPDKG